MPSLSTHFAFSRETAKLRRTGLGNREGELDGKLPRRLLVLPAPDAQRVIEKQIARGCFRD